MPQQWSRRLERLDASVDNNFSERLKVTPLAAEGYSHPSPDPERPAFELDVRLFVGRDEDDLGGRGSRMWNTRIAAGKAEAQVTIANIPEGAEFRKNDHVHALIRGTNYIVERTDKNEQGVLTIRLSETTAL